MHELEVCVVFQNHETEKPSAQNSHSRKEEAAGVFETWVATLVTGAVRDLERRQYALSCIVYKLH